MCTVSAIAVEARSQGTCSPLPTNPLNPYCNPYGDASLLPQGEVERVLSMVDAVLLVVDATEGPMSQTKVMGTWCYGGP